MQTLINFKNFVGEITANNSRNYKIAVLEKYKENQDIKFYLDFLFNPYVVTGISDKKAAKSFNQGQVNWINHCPEDTRTVKEFLDFIKCNNTGSDDILIQLAIFKFQKMPNLEIGLLFHKLITKNLPLGIDSKTINKVIPGLIPTFNVQLANKYFDKPEIVEGKQFAITTKIDGMRCIMMKENGEVTFWSRQGQQIEGLVDLIEEAKRNFPDNIALDGELIAKETTLEDTYKNTMKTARTKDSEKHNLKMMVFDGMDIQDFKNQDCQVSYLNRRSKLEEFWNHIENCNYSSDYFNLLPILYIGNDTSKITELLNEQTAKGEEGVMINMCDAPYDFKRTNNLLKVKKFQDCDLEVIGYEEGSNRLTGTLGALVCRYKEGNSVKVSGFTDKERTEIWTHKDEWVGKVITVKYFEETKNATGGLSLRFPTFVGERIDKGADY